MEATTNEANGTIRRDVATTATGILEEARRETEKLVTMLVYIDGHHLDGTLDMNGGTSGPDFRAGYVETAYRLMLALESLEIEIARLAGVQ